jgi:hypothetical protein
LQATVISEDRKICFPLAAQTDMMKKINRLAIFCGSKMGEKEAYAKAAKAGCYTGR